MITTSRKNPAVARSNRQRIRTYKVGAIIAGIEILRLIIDQGSADEIRYRVRFQCCGELHSITHTQLAQRARRDRRLCVECARRAAGIETAKRKAHNRPVEWYSNLEPKPVCFSKAPATDRLIALAVARTKPGFGRVA